MSDKNFDEESGLVDAAYEAIVAGEENGFWKFGSNIGGINGIIIEKIQEELVTEVFNPVAYMSITLQTEYSLTVVLQVLEVLFIMIIIAQIKFLQVTEVLLIEQNSVGQL